MGGGGSLGGGKSSQSSNSNSQSTSTDYGTNVWGPQQGFLQSMWQQGNMLSQGPMGGQQQFDQSQRQLGLAQQGLAQSNQYLQGFQNPTVDPAFQAYSDRIGQQYRQQFAPAMASQGIQAGQMGGSRQQIGNALGAQAGMQAISDFGANSYAQQQQRALQAASQMGQNALGSGQIGQQYLANSDFARGMPWYNQQMFSGLLGGPVMQDLGGYSQSTSSSRSKGKSWNIDTSGYGGMSA